MATTDRPESPPLPYLGFGSLEALQRMAAAMPEAVFTTDARGGVTSWNPTAERITGWSRDEALGKRCSILAGNAITGCTCGKGPVHCDLSRFGKSSRCCSIRTKAGGHLLIVKNAVALHGEDGELVGALESFHEVDLAKVGQPPPGEADGPDDFFGLVGDHEEMKALYRSMSVVAHSDATVMILGESGTGKERVAEAIHRISGRADRPFVRVNCAALNENLLESELFGHVKGAFTGAVRDRRGRFEEAHGGTLLLDEIGDISPAVQVKLLRVIEDRKLERVGDSVPRAIDVRILCATHRDLKQLVAEGKFRADLFFRLNVFPIRVPPLRDHPSDLPRLANRLLRDAHRSGGITTTGVSAAALALLAGYDWPGNVRELRNVLESAALRAQGSEIQPEHLPREVFAPPASVHAPRADDRGELLRALERHGWSRVETAKALGVSRVTLWKRMKKFGLEEGRPAANDDSAA